MQRWWATCPIPRLYGGRVTACTAGCKRSPHSHRGGSLPTTRAGDYCSNAGPRTVGRARRCLTATVTALGEAASPRPRHETMQTPATILRPHFRCLAHARTILVSFSGARRGYALAYWQKQDWTQPDPWGSTHNHTTVGGDTFPTALWRRSTRAATPSLNRRTSGSWGSSQSRHGRGESAAEQSH